MLKTPAKVMCDMMKDGRQVVLRQHPARTLGHLKHDWADRRQVGHVLRPAHAGRRVEAHVRGA